MGDHYIDVIEAYYWPIQDLSVVPIAAMRQHPQWSPPGALNYARTLQHQRPVWKAIRRKRLPKEGQFRSDF